MSVKEENEITVKIKCGINEFHKILEDKGFEIVEKFSLDDTYFIPSSLEVEKLSTRDILKSAVLVRDIHDKIKDKLNELCIPINNSNYFVKKAEIELDKIFGR